MLTLQHIIRNCQQVLFLNLMVSVEDYMRLKGIITFVNELYGLKHSKDIMLVLFKSTEGMNAKSNSDSLKDLLKDLK